MATIAALAGAAHAQAECELIPGWVKSVFVYYVDGQITEAELVSALQYPIDQDVTRIAAPSPAAAHPIDDAHAYANEATYTAVQDGMAAYDVASALSDAATVAERATWDAIDVDSAMGDNNGGLRDHVIYMALNLINDNVDEGPFEGFGQAMRAYETRMNAEAKPPPHSHSPAP